MVSHTVLSEMYQEKLVTDVEAKRMAREDKLPCQYIANQCTKPKETAYRTAAALDKLAYYREARQLRGW